MLKNPVLEAKGVWKGYLNVNGNYNWILKAINLELMEGEFISILGEFATGMTTLLKILGFLEFPDKGEVFFQGRLIGKSGVDELEHMHNERIWLIKHHANIKQVTSAASKNLAVVLLDKAASSLAPSYDKLLLTNIRYLTRSGITVIITTRNPIIASRADLIYKMSEGRIEKLQVP